MSTTTVQSTEQFATLYEYLKRPAGPALGYAVATYASKLKEPIKLKEFPHLAKPVNAYRVAYLNFAFNDKNLQTVIQEDIKLYNAKKKKTK